MKDLDFDELDQAVSSVLGNDTSDEKKQPDAVVASAAAPSAIPAPVTPPASAETAEPVAAAAPVAPAVSPAVRRRGQFLDMVHPASDMTGRAPIAPAARKRISPVSNNIAAPPTTQEKADETAAVTAVESEPIPESVTTAPTEVPTPPVTPAAAPVPADDTATTLPKKDVAWPDPLDLTPTNATDAAAPVDQPAAAEAEPSGVSASPESSQTPFVTDAKVDKRPLGAFGTTEADAQPSTNTTSDPIPSPSPELDEQRPPDVTPPELQPDVVSVESADNEFAPESPTPTDETPANSGLSQSIPQQYRTPAEAPDQAPHPIFDTDEYHQPLLPAAHQKKKRGWLVVVIIIALLVVGSVLGYFAYVAGL